MYFSTDAAIAMTGSDVAYQIPVGTQSVTFQPVGGPVKLKSASGANGFTLSALTPITLNNPKLQGQTVYLNGAAGVTVEILREGLGL
jgi:plastocyanin domain-containing protein